MASAQAESEDDMTDSEVIKALECCINDDCDNCPDTFGNCEHNAMRNALDLINRQIAEIERLEELVTGKQNLTEQWQNKVRELLAEKQIIEAEAIKEFAERLKHTIHQSVYQYWNTPDGGYYLAEDVDEDIDTLVEEMTVNYESSNDDKQRKEDEGNEQKRALRP